MNHIVKLHDGSEEIVSEDDLEAGAQMYDQLVAEASPTLGPWEFHEQGDANHYAILANDKKWIVALLLHNGETVIAKQRANMKLMAAAPDLARTLRLYVELFAVSREPVGEPYSIERKNQDFRIAQEDIAREILAKAGVL